MDFEPKNSIGCSVAKAHRLLVTQVNRAFSTDGFNVTEEQWVAIFHLKGKDGMTIKELSEALDKEHSATSRIVNGLVKRDLAIRVTDYTDYRARRIHLTRE